MEHEFWHEKWELGEIAFHEGKPNALLERHLSALNINADDRIFLPLCGKTVDIHWLREQGFDVVGADLSELAIQQLFSEMGLTPEIEPLGPLKVYSAPNLKIFVGDIFKLNAELLGPVDVVYDRAALVALPVDLRDRYAIQVPVITDRAPQLVITFDYDQSVMPGPPFSVPEAEVKRLYELNFDIEPLEAQEVPGGLKGKAPATETIWLLKKR